jgi:hypothetical protein
VKPSLAEWQEQLEDLQEAARQQRVVEAAERERLAAEAWEADAPRREAIESQIADVDARIAEAQQAIDALWVQRAELMRSL